MFGIMDIFGGGNNQGNFLGNLLKTPVNQGNQLNWGNLLGGALVGGVGQMMQDRMMKKPTADLANYKFGSMQNLTPEATQAIEFSLAPQEEQRRRQLRNVYASAMPGTDISNNTNYLRDMNYTEQQLAQNRNAAYQNAIANLDRQRYQQLSDMFNIGSDRAQGWGGMFGNLGSMIAGNNRNSILQDLLGSNNSMQQYQQQTASNPMNLFGNMNLKSSPVYRAKVRV